MLKKTIFSTVLVSFAFAFWFYPNLIESISGITLFLFGMLLLEQGFKAFTGGVLEGALRRSTKRVWQSFSFGALSATIMQSSHLVTLIAISFVSAEMITLASGIVIIIGVSIGNTTGAWLIAGFGLSVDIAKFALPIIAFGVVFLLSKNKTYKGIGSILLGIGFLFLGIHYMKVGFEHLQDGLDLSVYAIDGYLGAILFTLIGFIVTAMMQSSHASLLIIIAALATGQVTYENSLALAIGANLGSATTAAFGGMAASLDGKRLAMAHLFFNVIKAILGIAFIVQLAWLTDITASLLTIPQDNYILKLALFNTIFNLLGVIIFLPFVQNIEALLIKYFTSAKTPSEEPIYLFKDALTTPTSAVGAVRRELEHLFENSYGLLAHGISLRRRTIDSEDNLAEAVKNTRRIVPLDIDDIYENKIKSLHNAIVAFISDANSLELTRAESEELYKLRQASREIIEAVKAMKHMHKNLSRYGASNQPAIRENYDFIRLQLAKLLRELRTILKRPEEVTNLSIDALKMTLEKSSKDLIRQVDEQLRKNKLASSVATSIMNDEAYVTEMGNKLIRATQALLLSPSIRAEAEAEAEARQDEG